MPTESLRLLYLGTENQREIYREAQDLHAPSFYKEVCGGEDLNANYVMLMNDPSRPFNQVYEIDYDRHTYDGHNWLYINLPIEDIKEMAIASLKDSTMMYFSCDVGKFLDSKKGTLDLNNYDYGSLFGTTFGMNKKQTHPELRQRQHPRHDADGRRPRR